VRLNTDYLSVTTDHQLLTAINLQVLTGPSTLRVHFENYKLSCVDSDSHDDFFALSEHKESDLIISRIHVCVLLLLVNGTSIKILIHALF